jgi:hypothetical protein
MFALPEPVQTVDVDEHVLRYAASVLARVVVPILHQFNLQCKNTYFMCNYKSYFQRRLQIRNI